MHDELRVEMDDETAALAQAIGVRVRQERHGRRWTLDQLAEVAGVSRRMLVNVEQGAANPSVGTLLKLSEALGVGLPTLVDRPRPAQVKVTRRGEGAALWRSEAGGLGVLVGATEPPDVVELWDWTLAPGDEQTSRPHLAGTRELLQVHEGTVTVEAGTGTVTLAAGDAVVFPGDGAHGYRNAGDGPARFSLVVFEPVGGPATTTEHGHG